MLRVALPPPPKARKRRLQEGKDENHLGEEERMRAALMAGPDGMKMVAIFDIALDTGMRLGEILGVQAGWVRRVRGGRYLALPDTKNGDARDVVLTKRAAATLDSLVAELPKSAPPDAELIRLSQSQVEYRWRLARDSAQVAGLHFHDLRHEGMSRMAEKHLTIGELKAQSGHRTAQILLDYVNATVSNVARKLG